MVTTLWVALGSAIGGAARYWCSVIIARHFGETFPWGTLIVNVTGSLLIGVFAALTAPDARLLVAPAWRLFFMVGVFGGFTTFSTFSLETLSLMQNGEWLRGGLYVMGSVVLCLAGVFVGYALGAAINR